MTKSKAADAILEAACRAFCYDDSERGSCPCDSVGECSGWSDYEEPMREALRVVGILMAGNLGRILEREREVSEQPSGPRKRVLDL